MKKIAFAAALFAAFALASCGGNKTSDQNETATDSTALGTPVSDSTIEDAASAEQLADTYTAQLEKELSSEHPDPAKVKQISEQIRQAAETLQKSGNAEVAKAYASKVKAYVEKNAEKLKSVDPESVTVLDVVNTVANLPQSVKDAAAEGVDAVKGDGEAAKAAGKQAVNDAKAAAEAAGKQAVNDAKAAAQKAADKAKSDVKAARDAAAKKANDKANEAVQKGAAKANEAVSKGLKKVLGE